MSVLIYPSAALAEKAAATILAAELLENPYATVGILYDSVLDNVYHAVRSMAKDGVVSFENHRFYQLCEFVPSEEGGTSIRGLLKESLFSDCGPDDAQYVVPYDPQKNWAEICARFEEDILEHGGLDFTVLTLRPDGSLLYNLAGEDLAPVTHVELIGKEKVVSAGMATVMRSKKLIVYAAGDDVADAAAKALGGAVSNQQPASYLQLHQNVTFILDDKAASLL